MITPEILASIMFITTLLLLLFGFPVAFTLAGSALFFAFLGDVLEIFNFKMLFFFPQRIYGVMINEALVAVPLFIFMGVMLEKTNIAGKLLESIGDLFGSIRGGLGIGVVLVGMLLAASTGIVGATVVTMGMLALPTMLKAGYDEKFATGTICASGTLGQIIPPSIDQSSKDLFHRNSTARRFPIARYDDLRLLDNRWLAQLHGIASGGPPTHR